MSPLLRMYLCFFLFFTNPRVVCVMLQCPDMLWAKRAGIVVVFMFEQFAGQTCNEEDEGCSSGTLCASKYWYCRAGKWQGQPCYPPWAYKSDGNREGANCLAPEAECKVFHICIVRISYFLDRVFQFGSRREQCRTPDAMPAECVPLFPRGLHFRCSKREGALSHPRFKVFWNCDTNPQTCRDLVVFLF